MLKSQSALLTETVTSDVLVSHDVYIYPSALCLITGSNPTMTPIPAKSTTVFIKPTERDITTETVEVSVPTNSSTIMRNHTERNLAVITGGTLGGLILVMIVVILIIVVVLYKAKHKRENLTWERSVSAITL